MSQPLECKQKHSKSEIKPYKMHKGMKLLHLFELLVKSGFNELQTTSKEKSKMVPFNWGKIFILRILFCYNFEIIWWTII